MSDVEKIYQYLKDADVYYLATVDGDKPCVRPFSTVKVYEGKLYILTGKKKDVYEQLMVNPNAEIAVMGKSTWIHVMGTLKLDEREEPLKAIEADYPGFAGKYNQDETSPNAVFYFDTGKAVVSSWNTEPVTWYL
ncbi:MAG: pyridoxamine 5'-phosphate oxidase family protein [Solobacterium sp.]|nr:pyridoxamine 5'-phosphate oxidase family protein [Solobacterium sp.]